MMLCLRKLLFVAAVFSGKALGRATVIVSETPDPIYMTTTILIYEESVTPTGCTEASTSFSEIPSFSPTPSSHHALHLPHPAAYAPLPGYIPKPEPANEISSTPRLTTFITHTIPRTTTDLLSSLTVTATSTSPAASALTQSDTSPPPSSKPLSTGAVVSICVVGVPLIIGLVFYFMYHERVKDRSILSICSSCCDCCNGKKRAEPLESLRVDVEGETTLESPGVDVQRQTSPVELDATNEVIGELSAPETRPYHSHPPPMVPVARELDGSSTLSHHNPPSTSRQPAELPASVDEGASALPPSYEEVERETNGRRAVFSWAPSESTYRPEKRVS
ncbi:hypothetical protein TsFJ059_006983 [Trichoderma semiorbis]|uniref:Mid2 domain-containing protein n=1 Tax=Trichoderma semiorbis TaxID=1491008 RepID=A0A9P8HGM9_9HYPO|nr:hypothetical protein TsFJ059_006983 [Trichoderma semiorbis]